MASEREHAPLSPELRALVEEWTQEFGTRYEAADVSYLAEHIARRAFERAAQLIDCRGGECLGGCGARFAAEIREFAGIGGDRG